MDLPQIGLGTWELRGDECTNIVRMALDVGYRHIDTAQLYENHQAIHKAIQGFDRSKLYLTSKIALEEQIDPKAVERSVRSACEQTLKELGVDYLDLYLIHSPNRTFPMQEMFKAMLHLKLQGKIRGAGVSNFTIHHLEDFRQAGLIPSANQVEMHPYLSQSELLHYCKQHRIPVIAYRPFGKGKLLAEEPILNQIASKYRKSGAQVALRWLIQRGAAAIPKASSKEHLKQNFEVFDFALTKEEMASLDQLNRGKRYCRADDAEFNY